MMHARRFACGLHYAAFLLSAAMPLFAEPETPVVEVVGRRKTLADQSASTSVVRLAENEGRSNTLEDVLHKETSVRVRRYGGPGSQADISIRGANANQTNLYLDGIPLNNAVYGSGSLSDFNLDGMESVEIYRSGQANALSGSAIGGSVNLVPSMRGKGTKIGLRGGTEKTIDGFFEHNYAQESEDAARRRSLMLAGHAGRSDQDYKFRNNNGTPVLNEWDDFDDRRSNAWFRNAGFTGYGLAGFGNTDLKILDDFTWRNHGVPGPGSRQAEKTERHLLRNTVGIGQDTRGLGFDWLRLQSRAFYTYYREGFFDPKQEFANAAPNSDSVLKAYGVHVMPWFVLPGAHQVIRILLGEEREEYKREEKSRLDDRVQKVPGRFRSHSTAHIEDEFSFFQKRLAVIPSIRYEEYRDRFGETTVRSLAEITNPVKRRISYTSGSLFSSFTFYRDPLGEFLVRAGGSKEKRVPLFLELFGESGSIVGNPDLRPERAESVEAGLEAQIKHADLPMTLGLTFFKKDIRDMILLVPNSQFSLRPENIDAADIRGVEMSARFFLRKRLRVFTNYTYQRAINKSAVSYLRDKYLPLRPLHDFHGGVDLVFPKWETGVEADFTGAVFRDRTNEYLSYQPGRWVYNAHVLLAPLGRGDRELLIGVEVKNILDERMEDVIGYPLPGRTLYGTISYRF
jgi:iron complex outermembrane receptor protein